MIVHTKQLEKALVRRELQKTKRIYTRLGKMENVKKYMAVCGRVDNRGQCVLCGDEFDAEVAFDRFVPEPGNCDGLFRDKEGVLRHVCDPFADYPEDAFEGNQQTA